MRLPRRFAFAFLLLCVPGRLPASAETVVEAWRSPFGISYSVTVAPDGTCWAATGASVLHIGIDGSLLSQTNGFLSPGAISAAPDGGCWVCDADLHATVRLSADGQELWRDEAFSRPWALSVSLADGTGWVADYDGSVTRLGADGELLATAPIYFPKSVSATTDGGCWVAGGGSPLYAYVVRLGPDGSGVAAGSGFTDPKSVAADPLSGHAWVVDASDVVVLDAGANELARQRGLSTVAGVSVDASDGSCWIADTNAHSVVRVSPVDGSVLMQQTTVYAPGVVAPSTTDHSCWIAAAGGIQIIHMSSAGAELWSETGICVWPSSISTNMADGSAWVASPLWNSITHVGADGSTLWQGWDFSDPVSVSVSSADGSCWVADTYNMQAVHLGSDGGELWRGDVGDQPSSVSVNPADDSCWVASAQYSHVAHLSSSGSLLWQSDSFNNPRSVSVNQTDGSCWVADYNSGQVVHLSSSGSELWRGGTFRLPHYVSVNTVDGSVWVADTDGNTVAHLANDGTELWRSADRAFFWPGQLSVNPVDGSCWVPSMTSSEVVHLSARGHEKWRGALFNRPESVSVNPADGSCWVADTRNDQLVRLEIVPSFDDAGYGFWALDYIEACVEAGIVSGYEDGTYRPDLAVTRDQMAVYIARGMAGGEASVPTGPAQASFPDVPVTHWAFRHIEYAKARNVVSGYDDGLYHPLDVVDRGQMAVYVARAMVAPAGDAGVPDPPGTPTFPDVASGFWAYKHIEYCVAQEVVRGYDDGNYHPDVGVTRDQMAVYVARAFHLPV